MSRVASTGTTYAVHGACLHGVEALPVTVEVSLSGGIPGMCIVGMGDHTVQESRSRIRCALRTAGYEIPRKSITVNLAPADMRKTGSGLDLPLAVAILAASGQIPRTGLDGCLFVGEITLDGTVCAVRGEVAYQLLARNTSLALVTAFAPSHVSLDGVDHGYVQDLGCLRLGIAEARRPFPCLPGDGTGAARCLDYGDVIGQEVAKRAISIAAAGGLGMLMIGSPGSGKTMLARRMTGILPDIDANEQQEALCIHSVTGESVAGLLRGERPFRRPHHSISTAGLVGGGRPVRPGEISLAHGGVMFIDELAEWANGTLQALRQPMEEGCVRIVRVDGTYAFPSRFQLLAASNPCPCGYLGDRTVACRCSDASVERYRAKLGGPLADRIDLIVSVERPDPTLLVAGAEGMTTADLRADVERCRAFRRARRIRPGAARDDGDASMLDAKVASFGLDTEGSEALLRYAQVKQLTGRGILRLCRIARTIADMAEETLIGESHVLEASMLQGRRNDDLV